MNRKLFGSAIVLCTCFFSACGQVAPKHHDGKYSFSFDGVYFEVDPHVGGRISSFKLDNKEVLYTHRANDNNHWGSTFWPSPQSTWGWPPLDTIDSKPYSAHVHGNELVVKSLRETKKIGLSLVKKFKFDVADTSIDVIYEAINLNHKPASFGPWQITRVPSGGLTFFPSGLTHAKGDLLPLIQKVKDVSWFDYDSTKIPKGVPKLFSDGQEGWLAHVNNDGLLIVFKFADVHPGQKAPGEDEIEIYTNPDLTYTELEPLGPHMEVGPKDMLLWHVKWYVRKLPANIKPTVGNDALVAYVRSILKISK